MRDVNITWFVRNVCSNVFVLISIVTFSNNLYSTNNLIALTHADRTFNRQSLVNIMI